MMATDGIKLTTSCNLSLALKVHHCPKIEHVSRCLGEKKANICPVGNVNPPYPPPASLQLGTNPPPAPAARGWAQGTALGTASAPLWIWGDPEQEAQPKGFYILDPKQEGLIWGSQLCSTRRAFAMERGWPSWIVPCHVCHVCARDVLSCLWHAIKLNKCKKSRECQEENPSCYFNCKGACLLCSLLAARAF